MKTIFLSDKKDCIKKVYSERVAEFLKKSAELSDEVYSKTDISACADKFRDTEFIFSTWGMPCFSEEEIAEFFPSLKCVFYAAGTVQKFARPFLKSGVRIFSAWAANAVPVAEYTVSQIILANKGYFTLSRVMSGGSPKEAKSLVRSYKGNYGETVGIIGAGMIGKLVIRMLKAHNLRVIVFDPFLPDETAKELGAEKCSLEEVFAESSVVSNHLANNEQTRGMLNGYLFNLMRSNAVFINTGRGAQVVEDELSQVLKERKDITAVLDVTNPEPPESGHLFYSLDNCILTPHIAGSIGDELHRMSEYMQFEYEKYINGEKCEYEVTEKMLETMA